ncbi:nuclear transport factor 2 family protein [Spirillospora sp. NPDC029432]|uniref:nuclear transport factor 2 family protein n=1 Tax=Spirillospora sp. NPDC029432 TaxID=3154599 RepID=UPI00345447D7
MTPESFPSLFAAGWALPKPDGFLAHFRPLIDPEAVFTQPLFPDARGLEEIEDMFRRLFALFPDLALTVTANTVQHNTGQAGTGQAGTVYIESACTATLGREPVTFTVCDRFTIGGGTVRARHSYSDPLPVLLTALRRPSCWPRLVRSRL